jgi:hypothetical protein
MWATDIDAPDYSDRLVSIRSTVEEEGI